MASVEDVTTRAVGPYLLQRTLGKGQTGESVVGRVGVIVWGGGVRQSIWTTPAPY